MSQMIVSDDEVGKALEFLRDTDGDLGQVVGRVEGLQHRIKTAKAVALVNQRSGTVALKQAKADCSPEVIKLIDELENAVAERETLRARRKRAELCIEVWRTQNANMRRGNI